ncbi:MAG TPA: hypothetical protein VMV84_06455 [Dehalococcoidales bacterium]|nr:hypothetical protein [Dehalococcoidales bacterium]
MANLFRQAKQLLDTKDGEMTEEEQKLVGAAEIPLLILPEYNDVTISEGLEELATMVEEAELDYQSNGLGRESHLPVLQGRGSLSAQVHGHGQV